jgi:hypothetical protein
LNSKGQIAFVGRLSGDGVDLSNDTALWSDASGSLALIAREGDLAPGTSGGRFHEIDGTLALNSGGQVAFGARLQGHSHAWPGPFGIWAQDKSGTLRLVALVGETVEVGPGDFRSFSNVNFDCCAGGEEQNQYFNERGQVAFVARFTDGSEGIFVSDVATVPEPGSLALISIGLIGFLVKLPRWLR